MGPGMATADPRGPSGLGRHSLHSGRVKSSRRSRSVGRSSGRRHPYRHCGGQPRCHLSATRSGSCLRRKAGAAGRHRRPGSRAVSPAGSVHGTELAAGALGHAGRGSGHGLASRASAASGFIFGFVAAVALNTIGLVPAGWHHALSSLATWMITAALAAIGLSTRPKEIRRAGLRPLILGAILWATVGTVSLGLQAATGSTH